MGHNDIALVDNGFALVDILFHREPVAAFAFVNGDAQELETSLIAFGAAIKKCNGLITKS